jgi:hypothetical protein
VEDSERGRVLSAVVPLPTGVSWCQLIHARHTSYLICCSQPVFIYVYFKEYSDTEQSLTYFSEKMVETSGTSVVLMGFMMQVVAHLNSVEQHITSAIKNSFTYYPL